MIVVLSTSCSTIFSQKKILPFSLIIYDYYFSLMYTEIYILMMALLMSS